jgi:hypothetical protein
MISTLMVSGSQTISNVFHLKAHIAVTTPTYYLCHEGCTTSPTRRAPAINLSQSLDHGALRVTPTSKSAEKEPACSTQRPSSFQSVNCAGNEHTVLMEKQHTHAHVRTRDLQHQGCLINCGGRLLFMREGEIGGVTRQVQEVRPVRPGVLDPRRDGPIASPEQSPRQLQVPACSKSRG